MKYTLGFIIGVSTTFMLHVFYIISAMILDSILGLKGSAGYAWTAGWITIASLPSTFFIGGVIGLVICSIYSKPKEK